MRSSASGVFLGALLILGACTTTFEPKDSAPARPGIVVPDASGEAASESEACAAVTGALSAARSRLGCTSDAGRASCPAYIRPFGSEECRQYDKGTVEGCVAVIGGYKTCAELDSRPCIVVALDTRDPACGSETNDAGADAAPDAATEAASPDSGADASTDSGTDAPSEDAAKDASKDAPLG
jgi:hypothetical protein